MLVKESGIWIKGFTPLMEIVTCLIKFSLGVYNQVKCAFSPGEMVVHRGLVTRPPARNLNIFTPSTFHTVLAHVWYCTNVLGR